MTLGGFRAAIASSRAARQERRQLASDVASYSMPAQRLDFEAILDRYPAEETSHLRVALLQAA